MASTTSDRTRDQQPTISQEHLHQGFATAGEVFAVPELLEMILLELPMKDVLLLQRVNTTFQGTIQGSIRLRRHLFLEPPTKSTTIRRSSRCLIHPRRKSGPGDCEESCRRPESGDQTTAIQLNPLSPWIPYMRITQLGPSNESLLLGSIFREKEPIHISVDKHGSWRKMYAASSPMRFRAPLLGCGYDSMTIGELYDAHMENIVQTVDDFDKLPWVNMFPGLREKLAGVQRAQWRQVLGLEEEEREHQ